MKHTRTRLLGILFAFILLLADTTAVFAAANPPTTEVQWTEISTKKEFLAMRDNPSGNYLLKKDINLDGVEWTPFAFSGNLDGNGHTVLNLTLKNCGTETATTYDGNMKTYDTYFCGLFSQITNGSVQNLTLCNVRADVTETRSCFVGSIAGYTENATIFNCNITGQLSLYVNAPMFGVGGIVGYGNGKIDSCTTDTTLICVDTNKEERDEQFMGGAFAGGYLDVDNCTIHIEGYDSDHGYVHNGGVAGIYIFYPKGKEYYGSISHNKVSGFITFFEDNTNRRAYCKAYVGECMTWEYAFEGNGSEDYFKRDERFEYDKDLLPNMCENPTYTQTVTAPTENSFGYTTYKCTTCDYSYTDHYTLLHEEAEEPEAPVNTETSPETESSTLLPETSQQDNSSPKKDTSMVVLLAVLIACILVVGLLLRYLYVLQKRKNHRKQK